MSDLLMDDPKRLAALRALDLLDAPADESFDRLTRLAARLLGVPKAFLSLVDEDRVFYLSQAGFEEPLASGREVPGETLCHRVTASGAPLVIGDTRADPAYRAFPLVESLGIIAYAGVPLRLSNGAVIGAFCAADASPRQWSEEDVSLLQELATSTVSEIELRESRRSADLVRGRYGELIEDLDAIAWEFDLDSWRFTFVSKRAEGILGYPVKRWIEEPGFWEDTILHPEDRDWALAFCEAATKKGGGHEFDYRAVAEDGRIVWLKDRVRVAPDDAGRPRLLRGVMIDITGERKAAEALRESEGKFRQIAENVREIFWIFNTTFTELVYVSPAYEDLWGRTVESLYADPRTFVEAVHPEDLEGLLSAISAVAEGPVPGVEYRVIRPDGTIRRAFSRGYPVRNEDGEVYRVVGTTEDITERKQAQEQLAAAEAHYRRLVENAPYAIYALDSAGCFIELNPPGEALLEREPGELIGQHFSTVIAEDSLEIATDAFNLVISGEADNLAFEERVVTRSGKVRLIHVTESAIREGGVIVGTHGVGRDITGDFEKDRQLRRAERLASIGTLIGGVAHELNNPLQSISSFASLLMEGSRSGEEREDLETIEREALRASRIVAHLRLLARQAQDEPGERTPLDINDIVRHVLKTRRYAIETGNVEVALDLADALPAVLADRGQLEQVVLNLVVNAEQAMEPATHRRLAVRTRATDAGVALHVADSGIGIAAEDLEHIFDPFFTTKGPGEGTGLGLSLVYSIVSEHGGTVHVESERGKGTTFRVELPTAPHPRGPAAEPAAGGGAVEASIRPLRVLIVDDEPAIRGALTRYLTRRRGHVVDDAEGGEEALRMLRAEGADYDVIVSDLRMPGLGGDQLLIQLGALRTGMERRVIFLTGDATSGHAARVLAAANAPVLYKPIELAELAERIERHAEELREAATGP